LTSNFVRSYTKKVISADYQQERVPKNKEYLKWYLAGFADGEGCFCISVQKSKYAKFRWLINPLFQVYQHKDNSSVLFIYKNVFECGYVSTKGGNPSCYVYCVDRIQDLVDYIIPFFHTYPLMGEKYQNFLLFEQIVLGLSQGKHKTIEGFKYLTSLAFQMNRNGRYRKHTLEEIYTSLDQSSETTRQIPM
jgi:hypothetical protein